MGRYKSCTKYLDIQSDIINQYNIDICDGEKCQNDWRRTHAHVKERRVCKWKCANSIQSTFALFHEIGHIETTKSKMRRAESEYYATVWAIEKLIIIAEYLMLICITQLRTAHHLHLMYWQIC